jgi:hypothetical protein
LAHGRIEAHPVRPSAQQLPERLAANLAHEIPKRNLQRPAAAIHKLQIVEQLHMALNGKGVLAQKERFMAGKAQHGIARPHPFIVTGAHPHQCYGVAAPWCRVPGRVEGRIEGETVVVDLDLVNSR